MTVTEYSHVPRIGVRSARSSPNRRALQIALSPEARALPGADGN